MEKAEGYGGGYYPGGGCSGGGSINIFYSDSYTKSDTAKITTNGGVETSGIRGGAGGTGSVTIGNISTGTFVKDE